MSGGAAVSKDVQISISKETSSKALPDQLRDESLLRSSETSDSTEDHSDDLEKFFSAHIEKRGARFYRSTSAVIIKDSVQIRRCAVLNVSP